MLRITRSVISLNLIYFNERKTSIYTVFLWATTPSVINGNYKNYSYRVLLSNLSMLKAL